MKKQHLFMVALFMATLTIQAQTAPGSRVFADQTNASISNTKPLFASDLSTHKYAVAISAGSPGIGFEVARKMTSKLTARIAYHTFSLKDYKAEDVAIGGDKVTILGNLDTQVWDFGGEYTPFSNFSFKLTFGIGVLSNVNLNAKITYQEDITYGNVTITAANVGHVLIDSKWSGAAPFVGIGFGRAVPKHRVGLSFEIGTYFVNSPKVTLDATKLLAPTKDQEANLQDAFESLKFIPRAQIKLAIKI